MHSKIGKTAETLISASKPTFNSPSSIYATKKLIIDLDRVP